MASEARPFKGRSASCMCIPAPFQYLVLLESSACAYDHSILAIIIPVIMITLTFFIATIHPCLHGQVPRGALPAVEVDGRWAIDSLAPCHFKLEEELQKV